LARGLVGVENLMEGLARGEASTSVVSAVLGTLVLKEPLTGRKGLGLAAAPGTIAFLAAG
jgi:hypothetical protein